MTKLLIIYVFTVTCLLSMASAASAQGRLWMAIEAAHSHSVHQMDQVKASHDTSSNGSLVGERLWVARQNALDKLGGSHKDMDVARNNDKNRPEAISNGQQKHLVCALDKSDFGYLFKRYGKFPNGPENCN